MTNFAEKPFLPDFGGHIRSLLFELADEDTEEEIEDQYYLLLIDMNHEQLLFKFIANQIQIAMQ